MRRSSPARRVIKKAKVAATGSSPAAASRPSSAYTALFAVPSPGEKNSSCPSRRQRKLTSGRPSAVRSALCTHAALSLRSVPRNFCRAGVL